MSKVANINGLLNFMENNTRAFGRVRNTLKASGDMFLFGTPSEKIVKVMMKLYHENLIRNICYQDDSTHISPRLFDECPASQNLMCGIIQVGEELYITVAETPKLPDGPVENSKFDLREISLLALLNHCNISVEFPEDFGRDKTLLSKIAWRRHDGGVVQGPILLQKGVDILRDYGLFKDGESNYDDDIWSEPMKVNFINSYNYLERRLNGESFSPFKKYKSNSKIIECNNGSTCAESKLFSFLFDNLEQTFESIDGIGVFWIGNENPPSMGHILEKYCYSRTKKQEVPKLERIVGILESKLDAGYSAHIQQYTSYKSTMLGLAEQFALSCPGCYANYLDYKTGTYEEWNPVHCYERTNARNERKANRNRKQAELKAKRKSRKRGSK